MRMTPKAQQQAIAEFCGTAGRFVLMKRGWYYRPNAQGYTGDINQAWVVDEAAARKHAYVGDDPVRMYPAPIPDYPGDLNVMHAAEMRIPEHDRAVYQVILSKVTGGRFGFLVVTATAAQRAEALLRTIGKWVGE